MWSAPEACRPSTSAACSTATCAGARHPGRFPRGPLGGSPRRAGRHGCRSRAAANTESSTGSTSLTTGSAPKPPTAGRSSRDGTAKLLEGVATGLLKSRLRRYGSVQTEVESNVFGLLRGELDGARIVGEDWGSPLGLTARKLVADVGEVQLDVGAAFTRATIALSNKPKGRGHVVFNGEDFGNFLTHPLFMTTASEAVMGKPFLFDGNTVHIDPLRGCVHVEGSLPNGTSKFLVTLSPPKGEAETGVEVTAEPLRDPNAAPLSALAEDIAQAAARTVAAELTMFFNQGMVVDLSGAELSYSSMSVDASTDESFDGGDVGELHLMLDLNVYQFPAIAELEF